VANNADISELRLIVLNISSIQQQYFSRLEVSMSKQLDALTSTISLLASKVDDLVKSSADKDVTISAISAERDGLVAECNTLRDKVAETAGADSLDAIQAVADQAAAISAKLK
jgi:hypothetical protein